MMCPLLSGPALPMCRPGLVINSGNDRAKGGYRYVNGGKGRTTMTERGGRKGPLWPMA